VQISHDLVMQALVWLRMVWCKAIWFSASNVGVWHFIYKLKETSHIYAHNLREKPPSCIRVNMVTGQISSNVQKSIQQHANGYIQ